MHEPFAIRLQDVSKIYKLHGSQSDQLIDVLGLQRFGLKTKTLVKEFAALSNISFEVPRGRRVGIVGRNGAGKTTMLKLICGNYTPTRGQIEVNGTVQALLNIGLGFHPEYTGRENADASLQYNGIGRSEYQQAMEGIIEFCELGDFLDQPFKTYSMGMQARLMFAAATAIRPDILIIDEVLGAGDAYFVAKSKIRVQNLVSSGCTMLLVSHSMQQVLELCEEAIWLDQGSIRMQGEAFLVVKAYEEYLHGPIQHVSVPIITKNSAAETVLIKPDPQTDTTPPGEILSATPQFTRDAGLCLQEPRFLPHGEVAVLPPIAPPTELKFLARGGISRWDCEFGLKVCGFTIVTERGETNTLVSMRPAKFIVTVVAEIDGDFKCRYGLVFFDHLGNCITTIVSPVDSFALKRGEARGVAMTLNPNQLGPGEYFASVSVHGDDVIEKLGATPRYDLLNRSFIFNIELPVSLAIVTSQFFHSAEWSFQPPA